MRLGGPRSTLASEPVPFGPGPATAPPDGPCPRTAARLQGGKLIHAEAHLQRLAAAAPTATWLEPAFRAAQAQFEKAPDGMVRIRFDAGGGRLWVSWEALPETPSPYRLLALPHPLPPQAAPRIKGAHGAWHAAVIEAARAGGAHDALLQWPDGTVAETAIAAVVLERDGALWVPPPGGRVASLAESLDLPLWAEGKGLRLETRAFDLAMTARGTLWCLNAVRGVWQAESPAALPPMNG